MRWASLAAASEYAGVERRTLRSWIRAGLLPGYRLGPKTIQVDLGDIDRLRQPLRGGERVNGLNR